MLTNKNEGWLKSLQKGDEVAIVNTVFGATSSIKYDHVLRITPTKRIVMENGMTFRNDGHLIRKKYSTSDMGSHVFLSPINQDITDHVIKTRLMKLINKTNFSELPMEKLVKIGNILEEHCTLQEGI